MNPFEYREQVAAIVGYDKRTVDEVRAAQEARRAEAQSEARMRARGMGRKGPSGPPKPPPAPTSYDAIPKGVLDQLKALRSHGGVKE